MSGALEDWREGGFGLYLHWPFCASKCPYCDFNSHVVETFDAQAWATAYEREIRRVGAETPDRVLQTLYFGGGTPSLMEPWVVARVVDTARAVWRPANDLEITLEANPSSVEAQRFQDYRAAGVNRLSLGIQALEDADLRRLGRAHDVRQALAALDIARACFERVSFDLIYARQAQSLAQWRAELSHALSLRPDHLSLYQLTIEDGTVFGRRHAAGRLKGLPDEDLAADMYELTQELCQAAGLPAYEVSNHARPGQESRHNLIYWRGGDYVGIGPGAHGRLTIDGRRYACVSPFSPKTWLTQALAGQGEMPREALSPSDRAEEYLLMGLRLGEGIDPERYRRLGGRPLNPAGLDWARKLELLVGRPDRVFATPAGRMVLNRLIPDLVAQTSASPPGKTGAQR